MTQSKEVVSLLEARNPENYKWALDAARKSHPGNPFYIRWDPSDAYFKQATTEYGFQNGHIGVHTAWDHYDATGQFMRTENAHLLHEPVKSDQPRVKTIPAEPFVVAPAPGPMLWWEAERANAKRQLDETIALRRATRRMLMGSDE